MRNLRGFTLMELMVTLAIAGVLSYISIPAWKKHKANQAKLEKVENDPFCSQQMVSLGRILPLGTYYSNLEEVVADKVCGKNSRIAECYKFNWQDCRKFVLPVMQGCWEALEKSGEIKVSRSAMIYQDAQIKHANQILGCVYPMIDRTYASQLVKEKKMCLPLGIFLQSGQEVAYRAACSADL